MVVGDDEAIGPDAHHPSWMNVVAEASTSPVPSTAAVGAGNLAAAADRGGVPSARKGVGRRPGCGQLLQTQREAPPRMPGTHPGRGRAPLRALQRPQ